MTSNTQITAIGQIDERGYLNGFTKRGYTNPKCFEELVANILDSQDKVQSQHFTRKAVFKIERALTKLIDNGFGMNRTAVIDMFALHRENHSGDYSRGVAGIGAKPSLSILSEKTPITLYTRRPGGEYLCCEVPWDIIHRDGQYTGMIRVRCMIESEIQAFLKERVENGMTNGSEAHGTTIQFKTNNTLETIIRENFEPIGKSELQDPLDRIDVVFGKEKTDFILQTYDSAEEKKLDLYNYFGGIQAEYLTGISEDIIEQYTSLDGKKHRFLWRNANGEAYEITPHGKNWKTKPEQVYTNTHGFNQVGEYTVRTGFRIDPAIYNPDDPKEPSNISRYGSYAEKFLGESPMNRDYAIFQKIYRNNQVLGLVNPEVTVGNARADAETNFEFNLVQCEIYFYPISSQDNLQDKAMGTQENKNQFNPNGPPKNFTRLVKAIRHQKFEEIWAAIQESISPPQDEEDEEEEEEEEEISAVSTSLVRDMNGATEPTTLDQYIQIQRVPYPPLPSLPISPPSVGKEEENEEEEEEERHTPHSSSSSVLGETLRNQLLELYDIIEKRTLYTSSEHITLSALLTSLLDNVD